MIRLVRSLALENGQDFEEVFSFVTDEFIGIYDGNSNRFVMMAKSDCAFNLTVLPHCTCLDELDEAVYEECGEHIIGVSCESRYKMVVEDLNDCD